MSINDEDQVDDEIIIDSEIEETTEEIENEPMDSEVDNTEVEESPATIQESDTDEDDRVVTIGEPATDSEVEEDEEKQEAPGWVKKVRKTNRRLESENKRYKRQLEELAKPKEVKIELGKEPTFASCNYDETVYNRERDAYYDRKRKVEEQNNKQQEVVKVQLEKRQDRVKRYINLKEEHKFKDFSEAENLVESTFDLTQQEIIVQGAEDSALLVYALGKNPKKLDELSNIKDPVEFAFKVAKLESQLKVTNRKAPRPEKRVKTGKTSGISGNSDKVLDRLRNEAAETGDFTKVAEYKRKLRG